MHIQYESTLLPYKALFCQEVCLETWLLTILLKGIPQNDHLPLPEYSGVYEGDFCLLVVKLCPLCLQSSLLGAPLHCTVNTALRERGFVKEAGGRFV